MFGGGSFEMSQIIFETAMPSNVHVASRLMKTQISILRSFLVTGFSSLSGTGIHVLLVFECTDLNQVHLITTVAEAVFSHLASIVN